jgi:hypothetical protein
MMTGSSTATITEVGDSMRCSLHRWPPTPSSSKLCSVKPAADHRTICKRAEEIVDELVRRCAEAHAEQLCADAPGSTGS